MSTQKKERSLPKAKKEDVHKEAKVPEAQAKVQIEDRGHATRLYAEGDQEQKKANGTQ